jgi:hypothetical protein
MRLSFLGTEVSGTPTSQYAAGSAGAGKKPQVTARPVLEDYQLPLRYRRQPIDEKEIAYINVCKLVNCIWNIWECLILEIYIIACHKCYRIAMKNNLSSVE